MKQVFTKVKETDSSTIIGDFNTSFSIIDRTTRQKSNKEIKDLKSTVNKLNLTATYSIPIQS